MQMCQVDNNAPIISITQPSVDNINFSSNTIMVEVAYEFKDIASYFNGSMNTGNPIDMYRLFYYTETSGYLDPTTISPEGFAIRFVDVYHDHQMTLSESIAKGHTMAAVDLSKMENLKQSIDNLASAIYQENKKSSIETIRDTALHFNFTIANTDGLSLHRPFFNLYDFCKKIIDDTQYNFSSNLKDKAQAVINVLSITIIKAFAREGTIDGLYMPGYFGTGSEVKNGLSIFISRGNVLYNSKSEYAYQYWYTTYDTVQWAQNNGWSNPEAYAYGKIDFCTSDSDGFVETWRELFYIHKIHCCRRKGGVFFGTSKNIN